MLFFALVGVAFFCCYFFFFIQAYRRGERRPKGEHNKPEKIPLWKNLFYYFPKRLVADYYAQNPEFFQYHGCIIFTGRQGYGKTIAMAELALRWKEEYPKSKAITNFALKGQDEELVHWRQLMTYNNGIQGVISCIDEMQNWFSSNQSKDFPPEMLEVITQNRKNRRVIMGTTQSFNRISKPIREQATEVRKCFTFFHCLTVVHRQIPELDSKGDVVEWKSRGWYYFVHTEELRNSYDTYKVIESLAASGFQPRQPDQETSVYVAIPPAKSRRK